MDDNLGYLFAAFAISWLGIAGYLVYVSQQVKSLQDQIHQTIDVTDTVDDD